MNQFLLIIHVVVCLGIIGLVLIQHGKGADAGAAFGSGASGTVFGSGGSGSFLTRLTAILATGFFITSLALAMFAGTYQSGESVVTGTGQRVTAGEDTESSADDDSAPGAAGDEDGSGEASDDAPAPAPPADGEAGGGNSGAAPPPPDDA
jgi:preprotein translocase subunit SecG